MNRLRFLRNEKGESLEQISNYLNVTIQTVSNYENEKRDMSTDTIIKLANYFKVSIDYLLGKSDIRNSEINLSQIQFANDGGISTDGLSDEEIEELKRQVEFMRWKKNNKDKK